MGCGTSNQVHQVNNPTPIQNRLNINLPMMYSEQQKAKQKERQKLKLKQGKCYLFGQSSGERKVVCFNTSTQHFSTLSCRIRIPVVKVKMEPIQAMYQQSQEIILPELLKKTVNPPFNYMFATYCRPDIIFLCGGTNYEQDQVYQQSYFYNLSNNLTQPQKLKSTISTPYITSSNQSQPTHRYIKFQPTTKMSKKRYCHSGIYLCQKQTKNQYIYIFGGRNQKHQVLQSCQRYDFNSRKWRDIASLYMGRAEACAIVYMEKIYIFGGVGVFRQYPQSIQVYNPTSDTWSMLNITLHRGIRSCLVISPNPNQILILGGITPTSTEQIKLNSVIKVNLLLQTYVWETDLPQKLAQIKYGYSYHKINNQNLNNKKQQNPSKQQRQLLIFSHQNNAIYGYNIDRSLQNEQHSQNQQNNKKVNNLQNGWRALGIGYKNYIPVDQLSGFVCVSQVGQQIVNEDLKGLDKDKLVQKQRIKLSTPIFQNFFIIGNQNYPCILKPLSYTKDNKLVMTPSQISMKFQPKSNMIIVQNKDKTFVAGGCNFIKHQSYNQSFSLNINEKSINLTSNTQQLAPMIESRVSAGNILLDNKFYIFGGIKYNKGGKSICNSWQKYNNTLQKWQDGGKMIKPLQSVKIFVVNCQNQSKILIIGGKQQNGVFSSLIQLCNPKTNQIISYAQFPALSQHNTSSIFIQNSSQQQKNQIDLQNCEYLLQISQYYSNKQSIQKQQLGLPNPNLVINSPRSPKQKQKDKNKKISLNPIINPSISQQKPTFKNLVIQNIPVQYRKSQIEDFDLDLDLNSKNIDNSDNKSNVIEIKTQKIQIKSKKQIVDINKSNQASETNQNKNLSLVKNQSENNIGFQMLDDHPQIQQIETASHLQSPHKIILQSAKSKQKITQKQPIPFTKEIQKKINDKLVYKQRQQQKQYDQEHELFLKPGQDRQKQEQLFFQLKSQQISGSLEADSLLTHNKNILKGKNKLDLLSIKDYQIFTIYVYGWNQNLQKNNQNKLQIQFFNNEVSKVNVVHRFILLLNKKTNKLNLIGHPNKPQKFLTQPISYTKQFEIKQNSQHTNKNNNRHCFINLRKNHKKQTNNDQIQKQQINKNLSDEFINLYTVQNNKTDNIVKVNETVIQIKGMTGIDFNGFSVASCYS